MIDDLYIYGSRDRHPSWMFRQDHIKDDLTKLAIKYGTDRHPGSKHSYTPYYYDLFQNKRDSVKKVLEIGAGPGRGLRMWRDFFPNAMIYGADNDQNWIFKETRIEVINCDQSSKKDLMKLTKITGTDFDIVIDDASHKPEDQVLTCLTLMPLLKKDVIYIIEDVADPTITEKLDRYDLEIPSLIPKKTRYDDRLIVVRHKRGK